MEDIHTPSVSSGPTTNGVNGTEPKTLAELTVAKERIEAELAALSSVLDTHGVNMNTGLTTFDGFPRSDIDVPQIRTTRARIIHLRNDYKALMGKIEVAVQEQFATLAAQPRQPTTTLPTRPTSNRTSQQSSSGAPSPVPFAKVNEVTADSPAAEAGLRVDDKITKFGLATWINHDNLRKVAEIVSQNEGRPIVVQALRGSEVVSLALTPRRNWGGRGMLGCHLVPTP
ncbi:hypothetical protein BT63DRAFT_402442 [Microthyrium microscopicum]|uniref:Probable 26S proteasome regulatory subunit p27 n=1 Tax=Microthyrium microscopicum TaxID=703497 RepID=A0A6A6UBN4_9PEZI|nr:hypothetical protein BT63DRAFT_402442 [Microthyrium microscopicum]